jgi:phosphoribosylanthranilate isomerase
MQLAQIIDDEDTTEFDNIEVTYIKVERIESKEDLEDLEDNFKLVDAFVPGFGGEGKRIALDWFKELDCSKIILAGGLKAENLNELKGFGFYGVDVSSGVEQSKGKKDNQKMIDFVKVAHEI